MKHTIYLLLLLSITTSADQTSAIDTAIDAGAITQWQENWTAMPIYVSRSNLGSTGVTLTFYFRISSALPAGAVAEIHLPSEITSPASPVTYAFSSAQKAGAEVSVIVSGVTLPGIESAIGPFAIFTRKAAGGQIADMTRAFGSIYVTQDIGVSTLTVSLVKGTTVEVSTTTELYFDFVLTWDIWVGDIFVVQIDDDWSVAESPTCESVVDTGVTNYLVSSDGNNSLDCIASGRSIYIYGIRQEFDVNVSGDNNQLAVKLEISGIKSPATNRASSEYSWSISHIGSTMVMTTWSGTGIATAPGQLTLSDWVPSNGYSVSEIVQNLTMYMDLLVSVEHMVPANGVITLTFTNVDIRSSYYNFDAQQLNGSNNGYCYVHYSSSYTVSCNVTGATTLDLTATAQLSAGSEITISLLTSFTAASPTVIGTSYIAGKAENIDTTSTALTLSYASASSVAKLNTYQFIIANTLDQNPLAGVYSTGSQGQNYINFVFATSVGSTLTGELSLNLYLPANTQGFQDHSIWLKNDSKVSGGSFRTHYTLADTPSLTADSSALYTTPSSPNFANQQATPGSNSLSYTISDITGFDGARMYFFNYDGSSVDSLYLPKVQSNLWTRYETYLTVTSSTGTLKYVSFQQIHFQANTFDVITFKKHCQNLVKIDFSTQFDSSQQDDQTYQIQIKFDASYDNRLGSNLSQNEAYPHVTTNFDKATFLTLSADDTLLLTKETSYAAATTYTIYTAVQNLDSASNDATLTWQFTTSLDPNVPQIMSTGTLTVNTAATDLVTINAGNNQLNYSTNPKVATARQTFSLQSGYLTSTLTAQNYYMQFPVGFSVSQASIQIIDQTSGTTQQLQNTFILSSSNRHWAFPLLLGNAGCADTGCEISVSGVTVSQWSQSNVTIWYGDENQCGSDTQYSIVTGTIDVLDLNTTIDSRGPQNYHEDLKLTLITEHGIPSPGGTLVATLSTDWQICAATTCSVFGLNNVNCSYSQGSQVITLSGFDQLASGGSVEITLTDVMPPQNTSGSNSSATLLSSAQTSYSNNSLSGNIDSVTSPTADVTVRSVTSTGLTNFKVLKTIPPNESVTSADLYIKFALSKKIPKGANIIFESPSTLPWAPTGSFNNYVFLSKVYTSATVTGTTLTVTVNEEIKQNEDVELYVEDAFTTPLITTEVLQFKIRTTYTCGSANIILDDDTNPPNSQTLSNLHTLTLTSGAGATFQQATVTQDDRTGGESSEYVFTFTTASDVGIAETDEIWIKFPRQYDEVIQAYSGFNDYVRYPWQEPNTYYVDCSSELLGANVECTVDHRTVRFFNLQAVEGNQVVSVTISRVRNPGLLTTTEGFKIYQINQTGSIVQKIENIIGLTVDSPVDNIYIQSATVTNNNAFAQANYEIEFFLPQIILQADYSIELRLPRQYNTNLAYGQSSGSLSCSAVYFNIEDAVSDINNAENTGIDIGVQDCSVLDNVVTASLGVVSNVTFDINQKIVLSVQGLTNPTWGAERGDTQQATGNYDAWDNDVFPSRDFWTYQLELALYDSSSQKTIALSYPNINSAYLGFNDQAWSFQVNSFDPANKENFLKVYNGTQSQDYHIQTQDKRPLGADQVDFTPSQNSYSLSTGSLTFSSNYNEWAMYTNDDSISFRVGASQSADQGIFYIDWSLVEAKLDTALVEQYNPLQKTMVEVDNTPGQVQFTVTPNEDLIIATGSTSIPIKVYTHYSPNNDANIQLALSNTELGDKVQLSRSTLNYIPNRNQTFFTITISKDYDISIDPIKLAVQFTIGGTNASAYKNILDLEFQISAASEETKANAPLLEVDDIKRTTAVLYLTADVSGIVYTYCSPQGDIGKSAETLKTELGDYFKLNESDSTVDLSPRGTVEVKPLSTDTLEYTSNWTAFQYRLYKNHLMNGSQSQAFVSFTEERQKLTTLMGLWAETQYVCWAYLEDQQGNMSDAAQISFQTDMLPEAARLTIKFGGAIADSEDQVDTLGGIVAAAVGIQPARLINGKVEIEQNSKEEITETKFKWDLPAYRNVEGPEPEDIVNLRDLEKAKIQQRLDDLLITLEPEYDSESLDFSNYVTPDWIVSKVPEQTGQSSANSAQINATCKVNGFICAICLDRSHKNYPNHNQVLLGLDESNKEVSYHYCANTTSKVQKTLQLANLQVDTLYKCYVQCYNDYPTWPGYVPYSLTKDNAIYSVDITTSVMEDNSESDSANWLASLIIMLLVFQ